MSPVNYQTIKLSKGKHTSPEDGACVMELASMLAGERFSDRPRSVSPAIGSFMRGYNDLLDDRRRQDLLRYASEVVGTAGSESLERSRRERLVQWADERWARRSLSGVLGRFGQVWAARVPPAEPDSAGMYAVRALRNGSRREHEEALELLDELIAMGPPPHRARVSRRQPAVV
jgi:hypothetical protein